MISRKHLFQPATRETFLMRSSDRNPPDPIFHKLSPLFGALGSSIFGQHTALKGQRNPAPPGMVETCRKPINIYKYHGMLTTYYLVIRISLAHPQYVGGQKRAKKGVWPIKCAKEAAYWRSASSGDSFDVWNGFSSTRSSQMNFMTWIFGEICWNEIQSSSCFIRCDPHVLLLISLWLPGLVNQQFANWKIAITIVDLPSYIAWWIFP